MKRLAKMGAAMVAGAMVLFTGPLVACEIPVFRYALERWSPDPYQVLVVHRQPITSEQERVIGKLEQAARSADKPANLQIVRVDLGTKSDDPGIKKLQEQYETLPAPLIVLRQPHAMPDKPSVWTAPLTVENVERLADSPARQEVIRRLTHGQSAVWVMLETGNSQQDDAAAALIEKQLQRLAKELRLPDKQVLEADEYFKPDTKVALKLEFSLLRLKPGVAEEEVFRAMLLASEADLTDLKEPIAMPIFGRGRACFALVGKGINEKQIEDNCRFLVGRCSCQVKYDNPGVDLLLAADWDKLVGGRSDAGNPLPELSGLGVLVVDVEPAAGNNVAAGPAPPTTTFLGQNPVTPQAATTVAAVEPTKGAPPATIDKPAADKPAAVADARPAAGAAKPSAASSPAGELIDNSQGVELGSGLIMVLGIIAAGAVVVVILGTFWLRSRGGSSQ